MVFRRLLGPNTQQDVGAVASRARGPVRHARYVLRQLILLVIVLELVGRRLALQVFIFESTLEVVEGSTLQNRRDLGRRELFGHIRGLYRRRRPAP